MGLKGWSQEAVDNARKEKAHLQPTTDTQEDRSSISTLEPNKAQEHTLKRERKVSTNKVQSPLNVNNAEAYNRDFESVCKSLLTRGFIYVEYGNEFVYATHEKTGMTIQVTIKKSN